MKILGLSHIGNSRSNQEDNFLIGKKYSDLNAIKRFSKESPCVSVEGSCDICNTLIAVCDGMGGHASGEVASYLTVKHLADNHDRIVRGGCSEIAKEISSISNAVLQMGRSDPSCRGMGATLCGLILKQGSFIGFNVGDSRMYRFVDGALSRLTKDHTEGQRLYDLGLLSDEEIKTFPKRKALYKFIGTEGELISDVFELHAENLRGVFLLCTDGLCDVLSDDEIRSVLENDEPLKAKAERMISLALSRKAGQGDNITLILLEN